MEQVIDRFRFRLNAHGQTHECDGRSLGDREGRIKLQVWVRTPRHACLLLEVDSVETLEAAWPLFRTLCDHQGMVPLEVRTLRPDGGMGPWEPIPGLN